MDHEQRTVVGGLTLRSKGPRRGEVVAERYEVRGRLRNDAFSLGFLAFDQEEERSVLMRIIRPDLLDASVRAQVAAALRAQAGIGGNYLPGILDGDRDGPYVFATEPVPEGASFRDVLDRRTQAGRPLEARELLPLIAHLEAALLALPDDRVHGDVRAENVWTDPERLQLTGAFMLPNIAGVVASLLHRHSGLRRRFAPEIAGGTYTRASDLYGVGAIVYEALALRAPTGDGTCPGIGNRAISNALTALLQTDPSARIGTLGPLVEALARAAGLPVPELEPAPFDNARATRMRSSAVPPAMMLDSVSPARARILNAQTDVARPPHLSSRDDADDDLPPPPVISEDDRTQPRASIHQIRDEGLRKRAEAALRAAEAKQAKRRALTETERRTRAAAAGLDPRLVRAALTDDGEGSHHLEAADTFDSGQGPIEKIRGEDTAPEVSDEAPSKQSNKLSSEASAALDAPLRMARGESPPPHESASAVPLDPSEPATADPAGTQELALDELQFGVDSSQGETIELDEDHSGEVHSTMDFPDSEEVPLDPSVPVTAAKGGTQEIDFEELQDMERAAGKGDPAPAVDLGDLAGMARSLPRRSPSPAVVDVPKVQVAAFTPEPTAIIGRDGPQPQETPPPAEQAPLPVAPPKALLQAAPRLNVEQDVVTEAKTSPGAPKMRRPAAKTARIQTPKRRSDNWLIIVAVVLGAVMIAAGIWMRVQKVREDRERREQELRERYEQATGASETDSPQTP